MVADGPSMGFPSCFIRDIKKYDLVLFHGSFTVSYMPYRVTHHCLQPTVDMKTKVVL